MTNLALETKPTNLSLETKPNLERQNRAMEEFVCRKKAPVKYFFAHVFETVAGRLYLLEQHITLTQKDAESVGVSILLFDCTNILKTTGYLNMV